MKKEKVFKFKENEQYCSEDIDEFIENQITKWVSEVLPYVVKKDVKVKIEIKTTLKKEAEK